MSLLQTIDMRNSKAPFSFTIDGAEGSKTISRMAF
jgi:hypothetical protein